MFTWSHERIDEVLKEAYLVKPQGECNANCGPEKLCGS